MKDFITHSNGNSDSLAFASIPYVPQFVQVNVGGTQMESVDTVGLNHSCT